MSNLKKCPFCRGEAKIYGYYFIQCTKCGVSTLTHTDRESAINTWNTRIPTVEAEPVYGEWIKIKDWDENDNALFECNNCHHGDTHAKSVKVPYCWYCGAKMSYADMRGGKNE